MMYRLTEATYSELANLIQEAKEENAFLSLREDTGSFLDVMGQFDGLPDHHFFLYQREKTDAVGFAVILPHKEEGARSLGPIYVRQRYRGGGFGKQIVEKLIAWSHAKEIRKLFAQTWGSNEKSRRLLEASGFELLQEKPNTRVSGDSTVQYALDLRSK
jgi:RimJ/RimL family protein N-acetyltransferase